MHWIAVDVSGGLILDLVGSDYFNASPSSAPMATVWNSRVGSLVATVPSTVPFDIGENAFEFTSTGSETITVPFATNPQAFDQITYEVWLKLTESPSNLAWVISQSPDYTWSRAITLNDHRMGYVSITIGGSWNSELGQAAVNQWIHMVGVWDQGNQSTVYMNGVQGAVHSNTNNGQGSNANELLNIGGRGSADSGHNSPMMISDVRVYNRGLTSEEVMRLYDNGRRSGSSPAVRHTVTTTSFSNPMNIAIDGVYIQQPGLKNDKKFWQAETTTGTIYLRWANQSSQWIFDNDFLDAQSVVYHPTMGGDSPTAGTFMNNWRYGSASGKSDFVLNIVISTTPDWTTIAPTNAPTKAPTHAPTNAPTRAPTSTPTNAPTNAPTSYQRVHQPRHRQVYQRAHQQERLQAFHQQERRQLHLQRRQRLH